MKNFEKYKTPEEVLDALYENCKRKECCDCKYEDEKSCYVSFLYDEAEED